MLYGRVLIKRVRAETECSRSNAGFGQGRGCMDQVFGVRQVGEKYLANGKDVSLAFMELERACN